MFDLQPPRHISTLRISLLAARSRDGLLSEPTAVARQLCDGASEFGPLYRSSDPSGGDGISVEVAGLHSRAAFLVTSVCYDRLHHLGGRRWRAAWDLSGWAIWAGRWRSIS